MLEDAKRRIERYDSNHRLTSGELGKILTALVKDQDEHVQTVIDGAIRAHDIGAHRALPKFDLEGAPKALMRAVEEDLLTPEEAEAMRDAFRAYDNEAQPDPAPARPLKVGDKPPLGLRRERFALESRGDEILGTMDRYAEAKKPIPIKWVEELREVLARLTRVEA